MRNGKTVDGFHTKVDMQELVCTLLLKSTVDKDGNKKYFVPTADKNRQNRGLTIGYASGEPTKRTKATSIAEPTSANQ